MNILKPELIRYVKKELYLDIGLPSIVNLDFDYFSVTFKSNQEQLKWQFTINLIAACYSLQIEFF